MWYYGDALLAPYQRNRFTSRGGLATHSKLRRLEIAKQSGNPCRLSHGALRMAQRNLSGKDVDYIRSYGRCLHRAGAVFYFLARRDMPPQDLADASKVRLEGSVAVLDKEEKEVITVYRNRQAWKKIRRKAKYYRRKVKYFCPAA